MDWGDVPTWVNAGVTLLALGAAALAVRHARREADAATEALKIEQERDRLREAEAAERRKDAERAEQADLVAAWLVRDPSRLTASLADPNPVTANVENGSRLPVYDVELEFFGPPGFAKVNLGTLPHGKAVIDPPPEVRREDGTTTDDLNLTLTFRDTAGRVWYRDEHGMLDQTGRKVFARGAVHAEVRITGSGEVREAVTNSDPQPEPRPEI
jgi:hypothetical protein